jgi:CDP-glycerol glycerophosphotransferase (TagB/SpsB family)
MQPEASIDVLAGRNADQVENIRALSRLIPHGWEIYVKEHSNANGVRSPRDYDELRRIPGVRLIDPHADTFRLMEAAQLVLSPSGTVSFEAALLGRKAATLAPMYFEPVMNPGTIDLSVLDRASFERLLHREGREGLMEPLAFLSWLHAQSFPGRVGDPVHDPGSMTDENVAAVVDGFMALARLKGARQQPNASAA